jgi:hypothetical protein
VNWYRHQHPSGVFLGRAHFSGSQDLSLFLALIGTLISAALSDIPKHMINLLQNYSLISKTLLRKIFG